MNAESELEAVGMAWGAAATGTPAATGSTGQGLSLMQESLAEITLARLPLVVLNMARAQGDYYQATRGGGHGDYRHIVLAPADVAEAVELSSWPSTWPARWRNPVLVIGDYYLAHTTQSVAVDPSTSALDPGGTGLSTGPPAVRARPSCCRSSDRSSSETTSATTCSQHYAACAAATATMLAASSPGSSAGFTEDAEVVVVAFGTPARYVRARRPQLRAEGPRVGLRPADHLVALPLRSRGRAPPREPVPWRSTRTTRARWSTTSAWRCWAGRRSTSSGASASTARASASPPISTCRCSEPASRVSCDHRR